MESGLVNSRNDPYTSQGYATGQFGKNHLGDRNEFLPTMHGFDEFYGALYHLNASEEPENVDFPKDPEYPNFLAKFGPRGVLDCKASDVDDATVDPRFGKVGKQTIDTGALTKKRMETCDRRLRRPLGGLHQAPARGRQARLRLGELHAHALPHAREAGELGQSGRWQSEYHDAMIDHDKNVGTVLKAIDDLGIADDTIVMYSTDNGPHMNSWPDAAMTPFRSEKNSNWEGAYRVPAMVRWPGHIKAGTVDNDIVSHLDWLPTLLAAAGVPDVKEQLLKGMKVGDTTFKVHLDGYNMLPYLTGQTHGRSAQGVLLLRRRRQPELLALRQLEARVLPNSAPRARWGSGPNRSPNCGCPRSSICGWTPTNGPTSRRTRTRTGRSTARSSSCRRRRIVGQFLTTFKEFPPAQKAGSFSIDKVVEQLNARCCGRRVIAL